MHYFVKKIDPVAFFDCMNAAIKVIIFSVIVGPIEPTGYTN